MEKWTEVRRKLLVEKVSKRQIRKGLLRSSDSLQCQEDSDCSDDL